MKIGFVILFIAASLQLFFNPPPRNTSAEAMEAKKIECFHVRKIKVIKEIDFQN